MKNSIKIILLLTLSICNSYSSDRFCFNKLNLNSIRELRCNNPFGGTKWSEYQGLYLGAELNNGKFIDIQYFENAYSYNCERDLKKLEVYLKDLKSKNVEIIYVANEVDKALPSTQFNSIIHNEMEMYQLNYRECR